MTEPAPEHVVIRWVEGEGLYPRPDARDHSDCVICAGRSLTGDQLVVASIGASGVHYARCESCQVGYHYPAPTWHSWAGPEDIEHAKATGQADPSKGRCGCPCVTDAEFCSSRTAEVMSRAGEASYLQEQVERLSLDGVPCEVCGSNGACGYDTEGRAMIHVQPADE